MDVKIPQVHCPISEVFHQLNVIDTEDPVELAAGPGGNDHFILADHAALLL